jgi:hypothetical protein
LEVVQVERLASTHSTQEKENIRFQIRAVLVCVPCAALQLAAIKVLLSNFVLTADQVSRGLTVDY